MKVYVILIEWLQLKPHHKADVYVEVFDNRRLAEAFGENEYQKFIKNRDKNFGIENRYTNELSWHNTETGAHFRYEIFEKEMKLA